MKLWPTKHHPPVIVNLAVDAPAGTQSAEEAVETATPLTWVIVGAAVMIGLKAAEMEELRAAGLPIPPELSEQATRFRPVVEPV